MLRTLNHLIGYSMSAQDGEIGHAVDFLFDEQKWTIRYLVVDTGNWLPDRKVTTNLNQEIIEASPIFDPHAPVNRGYESRLFDYYGRPAYWSDR